MNPNKFIGRQILHLDNDTLYEILELPKKYSDDSKFHKGEYYTRVIRLTNNEGKTDSKTVLHINPNNFWGRYSILRKNSNSVIDHRTTKKFYKYICFIHGKLMPLIRIGNHLFLFTKKK